MPYLLHFDAVKRNGAGLSILEIIVALGLVSMVALAVIGVFSKLMTSSSKTADQAAAELLAQSTLDRSIRLGPPSWGVSDGKMELRTADSSSRTEFLYRVQGEEVAGSDHHLGSLYRVTVLVSWGGSLDKTEQLNQGKLWVERSRMTYVEATEP